VCSGCLEDAVDVDWVAREDHRARDGQRFKHDNHPLPGWCLPILSRLRTVTPPCSSWTTVKDTNQLVELAGAGMVGETEWAMQHHDDEDLAELICAGLDRAYRLAGLLLGRGPDAEDVVQDACVRAWQSVGSLRDRAVFTAWFDRIVVNICRDRIRRRGRIGFVGIEDH
jgi:hypothetical protein